MLPTRAAGRDLAADQIPAGTGLTAAGGPAGRAARPLRSALPVALLLLISVLGMLVFLALSVAPYADAAGGCGGG